MRTIIASAFILFFPQYAMTAENKYLETFPDGTYINWTAGEVGATGSSILKGKEWNAQNKIDAYRAPCRQCDKPAENISYSIVSIKT